MKDKHDYRGMNIETIAVHAGQHPDELTGALVQPVYMTSTFVFTEDKMERWLANTPDEGEIIYTYGRSRNPTQISLQEKIAALENAEAALVTASGMAAISMAIFGHCKNGDHIISAQTVYGGTFNFFDHILPDMGIEVTFLQELTKESLTKAKRDNTKLVYFESVANPTLDIPEFDEIVKWAKENNVKTVVDNTFTSPYLFRPTEWGIDTVVHSCTKYINGHGDLVGGVVVGTNDFCEGVRKKQYMDLGPVPAPMNCYLMLRGLKTLAIRMEKHCLNAQIFAERISKHPKVNQVIFPGLEGDMYHERASKYFDNYGGMVSFVEIPAIMTHGKVPKDEREKMGIKDGMIRVSLGIENVEDIISDFEQALEKI